MSSATQPAHVEVPLEWPWLTPAFGWLAGHQRRVMLTGVALQLAVLIVMSAVSLKVLMLGDTILLHTRPVDPRDLFRGDYVTLGYDISSPAWDGSPQVQADWKRLREWEGRTVYVSLEPETDGKHWRGTGYQLERPASRKFIRGTVMPNGIVQFGIESYFVQEGQGVQYEQAVRSGKLSAEVALDSDGTAQLKRLVIE